MALLRRGESNPLCATHNKHTRLAPDVGGLLVVFNHLHKVCDDAHEGGYRCEEPEKIYTLRRWMYTPHPS